jgi:hypothetical protein
VDAGAVLTDAALAPIVDSVTERVKAIEGKEIAATLDHIAFQIADLPGDLLGLASTERILIDVDAAGHGWFVDTTPWDNAEFDRIDGTRGLIAQPESSAANRMDLLTVVMHEFGHVLGYDHEAEGVMDDTLPRGTRRLWTDDLDVALDGDGFAASAIDRVFASLGVR